MDAKKFVEALIEEVREGNLPPPFVRALRAAEAAKPARKRQPKRPKTTKL